jgi:hypothetical protein
VVSVDSKDVIAASASFCLSWQVGSLCAKNVSQIFASALAYLGSIQTEVNGLYSVSTNMMLQGAGTTPEKGSAQALVLQMMIISIGSGRVADRVNRLVQGAEIWGRTGVRSAFWTGGIVTFTSFWLSWKGKEPKDMVVCVLNGGIRGSIVGLGIEALGGNQETKALRILGATVVGFVSGLIGSGIGTLAGWGANRCFQKKGDLS